jgi:hypothetical protein
MSVTNHIPRIVTFDIMRGFFLIAIIVDHIAFFPSLLDFWGMRGYLLVSTAEGFFLLSGIVLGLVRGAKLIDKPFKNVAKLVVLRAFTLYVTYIVLVIAFTLIAWYIYPNNPNVKYGVMEEHSVIKLIWDTLTMQYTYGWADYLRFYAIFIALSPLALWLLRRGKWYIVLLASTLVWLLFPLDYHTLPWQTVELLQPIPWQILFYSGLVIGFHWPNISQWCATHKPFLSRYVALPVVLIAVALLAYNIFAVFGREFIHTGWTDQISYQAWELRMNEFHKETLPFVRLALFFLWFWAAFLIIKKYEKLILKYTGWLLVAFGTNSLYVYTVQAVILFFVHIYLQSTSFLANTIVEIVVIAMIYLAIRTKFLMNVIPR